MDKLEKKDKGIVRHICLKKTLPENEVKKLCQELGYSKFKINGEYKKDFEYIFFD